MRRRALSFLVAIPLIACSITDRLRSDPAATPSSVPSPSVTLPPSARPSATPPPSPTLPPTPRIPSQELKGHESALLPDYRQELYRLTGATRYWIDVVVTFDPVGQKATIEGSARIQYTNPSRRDLNDFVLMLWPNHDQYRSSMDAGPAQLGDETLLPREELQGIALRYALPEPLQPAATLDISVPFSIQASGPIGGGFLHRFGITQGVFIAPTFYPLVPRLLEDAWQVEDAPPGGDTTNSDTAFFEVRLTAPSQYGLAASGVEIEARDNGDGTRTTTFVTGPMRDFAFALGKFSAVDREVGEVKLRAWVLPSHADQTTRFLDHAEAQMELLEELVGPYPYTELDLVDAPDAFGGIEYPGLVFVGTLGGPNIIDATVHEVAHQWFYGLIGDDQLREPWLDEAAATYAEILFYERVFGSGTAAGLLRDYRSWVRSHRDPTIAIGLGIGDYASPSDYGLFVYIKGALFFDALRRELGDERFFSFLRAYFESYRYGFATASGFHSLAEQTCSCDLDSLFDLWVYKGGQVFEP
ncbi:MAG TPA: M1 family metallopeptidase [Anaerolineales bacterium]|nr:M1 family metallopeptidase [Anaerolineales bacterium]